MSAEEKPNPPTPFPTREGGAGFTPPSLVGKGVGGLGSSRKLLALIAVGFVAVGFAVWYFFIRTPEPKDDFGRFQGAWRLIVPDGKDSSSGRATPVTIRVTGDRWVWVVGDKEQKRYAMELRPDTNPKEIDLVLLAADDSPVIQKWPGEPRKVMLRGIYVVERDSAKLVVRPGDEPRPTSLEADEGVAVWILERQK
ncbi:MAG: TIGR03067 domain-containing protein [Planctomycetia bacterium]|nr:TIGR03067 domain-containing protein [Planctomycetia bacterium]